MRHLPLIALLVAFLSFSVFAADDPPPRGGTGKVTIITDPPNSQVFLGGEELGKSPIIEREFKSGRHTLIVIDQDYELVNTRFNVWPNKLNTYDAKTVIPKGNIRVTTTPSKCIIYVDGDQSDQTDGSALTIRNLDAGDHLVRAECSNRKSAEMLVNVEGETTKEIHLDASGKK